MASPIKRQHLRYAREVGTWRHLVRRARWRAMPRPIAGVPLTWPLAPGWREDLKISWPAQYGWDNAAGWIDPVRRGIAGHVNIKPAKIPQPLGNVVLFHVEGGANRLSVVIDYDDQLVLNESAETADVYFKMQYRRGGYGDARIRPGGYITKHPALYAHAHRWRALRDSREPDFDVIGRFGMKWAQDIRTRAITLLGEQRKFGFEGGAKLTHWGQYMDETCAARVCLDLPGNGELCYRLVEYLAVGACVVGPELEAELHVPLQTGVHLVRVPRTLEGLVECCERLLGDEDLRSAIRGAAEDYFDRYLALEQLGAYYLDEIAGALV
jgi:hypothetical protein